MALRRTCELGCRFCGIFDVFDDSERPKGDRVKRATPADSAHQEGLTVLQKERLMGVEGIRGHGYSNCDITHVFDYCGTTIIDTWLWRTPLDSAHQIGPETIYN